MQKILRTIKHELLEVLPPTIFFFVAFNVVTITKRLMLEQYGIEFFGFVTATVGALVVAKVVLLADNIPFINNYPDNPLIYNVVWKTVIYVLVAVVVRWFEFFFPLWWKYRDLSVATGRLWEEISWPQFWAIHIWLVFLFFVYVSFRELARTLGEEKFIEIFLGIKRSTNHGRPE
jgi:hypothetical protein